MPSGVSLRESAAREQLLGPPAFVAGFPDGVAFDHLDGLDAGLASLAPLHHALHGFERVEVHGVGAASRPPSARLRSRTERQFEIGQPPGDRQRGARQHGKLQALRCIDHPLGLLEAVGEVLVVVDRHGAAVFLEYVHALLEELIARVEDLPLLVLG